MRLSYLTGLILLAGCPAAQIKHTFDTPIPPEEPRATLELELTLEPQQDCEEAFDLELYRQRGIELIAWDRPEGPKRCASRRATIRYIPGRIQQEQVMRLCREAASRVEQVRP